MSSQNGVVTGSLTKTSFDAAGALTLTYSNGRVIKGAALALIGFNSQDAVAAFGNNQFRAVDPSALTLGVALQGAFGRIKAGVVEASNVDLAQEFSDLVVMQRGYQSSSQVISTANEMLQQLFSMKSK
jgi:flagellar hook protein FlgE